MLCFVASVYATHYINRRNSMEVNLFEFDFLIKKHFKFQHWILIIEIIHLDFPIQFQVFTSSVIHFHVYFSVKKKNLIIYNRAAEMWPNLRYKIQMWKVKKKIKYSVLPFWIRSNQHPSDQVTLSRSHDTTISSLWQLVEIMKMSFWKVEELNSEEEKKNRFIISVHKSSVNRLTLIEVLFLNGSLIPTDRTLA